MCSIRFIFFENFSIRFLDVPQVTNLLSFLLSLVPFEFFDVGHFFVSFLSSRRHLCFSRSNVDMLFYDGISQIKRPPIIALNYSNSINMAMFIRSKSSPMFVLYLFTLLLGILPTFHLSLPSYYFVVVYLVKVRTQKCRRFLCQEKIYKAVWGWCTKFFHVAPCRICLLLY